MVTVWHRRDLRIHDNPALARAVSEAGPDEPVRPVFVADPRFYGEGANCDGRVEFVLSSVEALDAEYSRRGSGLSVLHGDSVDRLERFAASVGDDERVYYLREANSGYARDRDRRARRSDTFVPVDEDGIVRDDDTRDGWRDHVEDWFASETYDAPEELRDPDAPSDTTVDGVRETYDVDPTKPVPEAGESAALDRLGTFLDRIDGYPSCISPPYDAEGNDGVVGTSRLSPYISVGSLSLRVAYQRAVDRGGDDDGALDMFVERLFWNRHFTQKLEDNPDLPRRAVNPVFRGMNRNSHDPALVDAWRQGRTGYPLVDASMRALRDRGWLNFRMRAMVASFFTYILKQPWWIGADHMRRELIDGDTAINYAQWQMQSGLVGVHPNRIYNPTKQVRENDPDGRYIREYVPELRDVPDGYIAEPWTIPASVQEEVGVTVGDDGDYPAPVVDFEEEARRAREVYSALADRAKEALSDPDVYERASLPERRSRDELTETSYPEGDDTEQKGLDDF